MAETLRAVGDSKVINKTEKKYYEGTFTWLSGSFSLGNVYIYAVDQSGNPDETSTHMTGSASPSGNKITTGLISGASMVEGETYRILFVGTLADNSVHEGYVDVLCQDVKNLPPEA